MESTTPTSAPPHSHSRNRSSSRNRPTTPLRATSRTSLRASKTTPTHPSGSTSGTYENPLNALEPAFTEFSDSMADLEANMLHLQLLQESLTRFNENFGGFLYGMNMNAFTVDFTEAPGSESFKREKEREERGEGQQAGRFGFGGDGAGQGHGHGANAPYGGHGHGHGITGGGLGRDVDATFLTSDTSFVDNPPTPRTSRTTSKFTTPAPPSAAASSRATGASRGGSALGRRAEPSASSTVGRGRGVPVVRGTRASALAAERRETIAARGRGRGGSVR